MHDIKWIRANPEAFDEAMAKRGLPPQSARILELDAAKRARQNELQELLAQRNQFAKRIGQAKVKGEDTAPVMEEAKRLNEKIAAMEQEIDETGELEALLASLPNIPAEDVPIGPEETTNKVLRSWGEKPSFVFKAREHFELGEALGLMDFESAVKISGSRFVVLKGALARLERALASFFLDHNTQQYGYTEVVPPFLVKDNAAFGTGQLPKFNDQLFRTSEGFWLIPTAEVPLTNLVADSILDEDALPLRYTAYTPCFRSEAGAAGRDTRGMIRQHQFSKVELVSVTTPEQSQEEHERMTACAESLLQKLGLPYQVVLLSTEAGFSNQKTYDIEVWLPGQNTYREISSCSNCGAFQARRMKARFKRRGGKDNECVHTLNGSGLPIGRTMVAILENYQEEDGSVTVPEALRPYMGGITRIGVAEEDAGTPEALVESFVKSHISHLDDPRTALDRIIDLLTRLPV